MLDKCNTIKKYFVDGSWAIGWVGVGMVKIKPVSKDWFLKSNKLAEFFISNVIMSKVIDLRAVVFQNLKKSALIKNGSRIIGLNKLLFQSQFRYQQILLPLVLG